MGREQEWVEEIQVCDIDDNELNYMIMRRGMKEMIMLIIMRMSMFKIHKCHRTSFEGTMSRSEWTTGPTERRNINPFCYLEDAIPSQFILGMWTA